MRSGSRRTNRWLLAAAAAGAVALPALAAAPARPPVYERDVLPLLGGRCAGCHGAAAPHAGLDLRTGGDLLQGGYSGSPVVPGSPEKSLLYRMLQDGRMPKGGRKLTPPELAKVAAWIRAGARFTTGTGGHWAFRAPRLPAVPSAGRVPGSGTQRVPGVQAERGSRNPVDGFVQASLRQRGLGYSPEASPAVLIRRVTFDLIGLPPTPEEVDAFVKESSSSSSSNSGADRGRGRGRGRAEPPTPSAYDRLVDRLLADPRYGERWARHWLDAAGYADSEGVLQEDRIRPNAWRYRDYVIRSFNEDRPYDRFIREQIAGDELADYRGAAAFTDPVTEPLVATGFLRTAVDATRDDFNPHQYGEYQYRMLHDTQTIVSTAVMGLTVQCSRCHDHKYEPLSQRDYYRFQALFMGAVRPRGTLLPTSRRQIVAATAAEQERAKQVNAKVEAALAQVTQKETALLLEYRPQAIDAKLGQVPEAERPALREAALLAEAKRTPAQKELIARFKTIAEPGPEQIAAAFPEYGTRLAALKAEREAEAAKRVALPEIRAFYDQDAAPPPTPILIRGDWLRPGETVQPGVPAALDDPRRPFSVPAPAEGARTTGRRRALAEWLTRPDHPLTARVIVNRVWAYHFGAGLVPSVENFGRSGQRPTHPALLDYLAYRFAEAATSGPGRGRTSRAERRTPNAERRPP